MRFSSSSGGGRVWRSADMAVDVRAEVPGGGAAASSPRISFSHDLNQDDDDAAAAVPIDGDAPGSDFDFDFCVAPGFSSQEFPTADELFSHGKILPIEVNRKAAAANNPPPQPPTAAVAAAAENSKKMKLKELLLESFDDENEKHCLTSSPSSSSSSSTSSLKSFWQFGRSASLNCADANRGRGLIRSLQFLSRSNSTGSAPNPKQAPTQSNPSQSRHLRKQSSSGSRPKPHPHQKPPLKKNCRAYGDGVRINPVLNLPPQYISRATQGLFGLGSMLCSGKDNDRKKKKKN